MTTKHTPGPWEIMTNPNELSDKAFWVHDQSPDELFTAYVVRRKEDQANAHLIAAAPEMLEALKDAVSCIEYLWPESFDDDEHEMNWHNTIKRYNEIIAKAEGRAQ